MLVQIHKGEYAKGASGFICDISVVLKNVPLCCADLQVSYKENTNNFGLPIISLNQK